jgi:hypothetical protein
LAYVGGYTFELKGLETCPAEEGGMLGGEATEEFCDVFIRVVGADGLLLCRGHLGRGVLADRLVRWPVLLLAIRGLLICGQLGVRTSRGMRGGMLTQ